MVPGEGASNCDGNYQRGNCGRCGRCSTAHCQYSAARELALDLRCRGIDGTNLGDLLESVLPNAAVGRDWRDLRFGKDNRRQDSLARTSADSRNLGVGYSQILE